MKGAVTALIDVAFGAGLGFFIASTAPGLARKYLSGYRTQAQMILYYRVLHRAVADGFLLFLGASIAGSLLPTSYYNYSSAASAVGFGAIAVGFAVAVRTLHRRLSAIRGSHEPTS